MRQSASRLVAVLGSVVLIAGCFGAYQVSPDNVLTVGGLTPNVEDKDAGLVALSPGLNIKTYFGGDAKDHWKESRKFLVRLANGQAPGK